MIYLEARCLTAAVEQFISCSACRINRISSARVSRGFGLYDLLPLPNWFSLENINQRTVTELNCLFSWMDENNHTWHNQNIEFIVFKVKQLTKSPACTRSSLNKIEYLKERWEAFLLISSMQQLLLLVPEQAKCI